jgi:acetylornithine deacetylase/succinyl-diaminopimelate desuccinylase-like protein
VTEAGTTPATPAALDEAARTLMPELKNDLVRLSRIPSIAFTGFPREPLIEAHDLVVELLRAAGVTEIESLTLPNTAPVIIGAIPAPEGAPTVLLYGHYDVVPAGDESLWTTPAFEPVERDGAIFGRGTSDSKANIVVHLGALRAWGG